MGKTVFDANLTLGIQERRGRGRRGGRRKRRRGGEKMEVRGAEGEEESALSVSSHMAGLQQQHFFFFYFRNSQNIAEASILL